MEVRKVERRQWVVDQTIFRAKSKCEISDCQNILIEKDNESFYVEVHHLITLANGGPDTLRNTVCLCPGHHREIHYGKDKKN